MDGDIRSACNFFISRVVTLSADALSPNKTSKAKLWCGGEYLPRDAWRSKLWSSRSVSSIDKPLRFLQHQFTNCSLIDLFVASVNFSTLPKSSFNDFRVDILDGFWTSSALNSFTSNYLGRATKWALKFEVLEADTASPQCKQAERLPTGVTVLSQYHS